LKFNPALVFSSARSIRNSFFTESKSDHRSAELPQQEQQSGEDYMATIWLEGFNQATEPCGIQDLTVILLRLLRRRFDVVKRIDHNHTLAKRCRQTAAQNHVRIVAGGWLLDALIEPVNVNRLKLLQMAANR
jgi:hypothetical protein